MSHYRLSQRRRGAILLQVSFLLLVLMGLAAVVVELGIARATQVQMQASVDPAALAGLRLRDANPGDPLGDEAARRLRAIEVASALFDDDLDPATLDTSELYGAGPILSTGVAGIDAPAGGLLETSGPYRPVLQANLDDNAVHGDLVAGAYLPLNPLQAGDPLWHVEGSDYVRPDFQASPASSAPAADAFLVRHRRTRPDNLLDRIPGVSTAGPTIPFLFGLGSGVLTSDVPEVYDPRRDGITVRAVAIAAARPALAAGVARAGLRGLAVVGTHVDSGELSHVLALDDEHWSQDLQPGDPFEIEVDWLGGVASGPSGISPTLTGYAGRMDGWLRVGPVPSVWAFPGTIVLGTELLTPGVHHVALIRSGPGAAVVIGFGAIEIKEATLGVDSGGAPLLTIAGRKLARSVALENASAVPSLAEDVGSLALDEPGRALLLAPVLVR